METDLRVNSGFFLFRREIFDFMRPGEELVQEPFARLIEANQLLTHQHDGFAASMDTFKDKQHFDELYSKGRAPWEVWRKDVHAADSVTGTWAVPPLAADTDHDEKPGVRYNGADTFLSPVRVRPDEPARAGAGLSSHTSFRPYPTSR
jgi:NDP-sugar pyrophosphorylase family protein